uniref:Uncharacterized protein n=1 Tax=Rhizophora mucronata TaxID=61149 RepID=A0A2P2PGZ8_RHIMU
MFKLQKQPPCKHRDKIMHI